MCILTFKARTCTVQSRDYLLMLEPQLHSVLIVNCSFSIFISKLWNSLFRNYWNSFHFQNLFDSYLRRVFSIVKIGDEFETIYVYMFEMLMNIQHFFFLFFFFTGKISKHLLLTFSKFFERSLSLAVVSLSN